MEQQETAVESASSNPTSAVATSSSTVKLTPKQQRLQRGLTLYAAARGHTSDDATEELLTEFEWTAAAAWIGMSRSVDASVSSIGDLGKLLPRVFSSSSTTFVVPDAKEQGVHWCIICVLNGKDSNAKLSVSIPRNLPGQFTSHCKSHHPWCIPGGIPKEKESPSAVTISTGLAASFFAAESQPPSSSRGTRSDTGRTMVKYDSHTDAVTKLIASSSLSLRFSENPAFRAYSLEISRGYLSNSDLPSRAAVAKRMHVIAQNTLLSMKAAALRELSFNDGTSTLNNKGLIGLAGFSWDGWSATQNSNKMQGGALATFSNVSGQWRYELYGLGFTQVPSKHSKETFEAAVRLFERVLPIQHMACRNSDLGSDNVSQESIELWYQLFLKTPEMVSQVAAHGCNAHLLDKALQWAAVGGGSFSVLTSLALKADDERETAAAKELANPVAVAAAAAAGAALDGTVPAAAAALNVAEPKPAPFPMIAPGKRALKPQLRAVVRGANSFALLAGSLLSLMSDVRNNAAALKMVKGVSGYSIPTMVLRDGVATLFCLHVLFCYGIQY